MRTIAAAALLLIGLAGPALAETSVGVTAAVNQDAKGIVGSSVKTISLGDSVVFNQRIQTGGGGLVQVLLADGTTFMVGPNSDLVIDSFVYDPNAGTAQVTASFTKGVLRFIGGQTSKTENGVTINTPVGTMGIRGAMVDVVLDPPAGTPPHIDMLFGNEVTLEQGKALLGRLYAAGYSLALGPGGSFDVLKTPPGWGSQIQAALAGQPGTKGGAPKGPSDDEVKNSEVAENNSGKGPDIGDGLTPEERKALLEAAAHYDELRNLILNNQNPYGLVGGVLSVSGENFGLPFQNAFDLDGEDGQGGPNPAFAQLAFNADNDPVAVKASLGFLGDTCSYLGGCLVYEGGGDGGTLTYVPSGEGATDPQSMPVDGYLYNHDDPRDDNPMNVALDPESDPEYTLADQLDCENCDDFVRWGFWGFSAEDVQVGSVSGDIAYDALWVNGELTTAAQLDTLEGTGVAGYATATYAGDAIGNVNNNGQTYTATGDLSMSWDFGIRQGEVQIDDFDMENFGESGGIDVGGQVISFDGQTGFGGVISGDGNWGIAQGAFVNNGGDPAAGVIGNFGFGNGSDYTASGVFMGEQYTATE